MPPCRPCAALLLSALRLTAVRRYLRGASPRLTRGGVALFCCTRINRQWWRLALYAASDAERLARCSADDAQGCPASRWLLVLSVVKVRRLAPSYLPPVCQWFNALPRPRRAAFAVRFRFRPAATVPPARRLVGLSEPTRAAVVLVGFASVRLLHVLRRASAAVFVAKVRPPSGVSHRSGTQRILARPAASGQAVIFSGIATNR